MLTAITIQDDVQKDAAPDKAQPKILRFLIAVVFAGYYFYVLVTDPMRYA